MTEPAQPALEVDLIKLSQLHKWLMGFFIMTVGVIIALYAVPAESMTDEIAAISLIALNIGVWGYYITLGRMASALHKSIITWVGLSFVLNIFGFIGSFFLMNSRVLDARQDVQGKSAV